MKSQTSQRRNENKIKNAEIFTKVITVCIASFAFSGVIVSSYEGIEVMPREDISVIGDLMRSEESASTFFNMVDRDGDGKLRAPEVAKFLRESIGGTFFDDTTEVDNEVLRVMKKLDQNHDDSLDQSDVMAHWTHLESLLTVMEVSEWVVYAVQLPEYIGKIFRENVVTGYDFPELVEDGGKALETELGITKSSFRRKIVRLVQARMLGIGSTPTRPQNLNYVVESCTSVNFTWDKSTSKGFPTHSYRLQRRKVGDNSNAVVINTVSGDKKSNHRILGQIEGSPKIEINNPYENSSELEINRNQYAKQKIMPSAVSSDSEWKTVGVCSEQEFVDSTLEPGVMYNYRIQAWNSVGHSGWTKIDFNNESREKKCKSLKRSKKKIFENRALPSVDMEDEDEDDGSLWHKIISFVQYFWAIATFFASMSRVLMSFMAVAVTIMKFKRASVQSTYSPTDPIFQRFFVRINKVSLRIIGIEIIPKVMVDNDPFSQHHHDETVKAVGLNGYDTIKNKTTTSLRTPRRLDSLDSLGEKSGSTVKQNSKKQFFGRSAEKVTSTRVKRKFKRPFSRSLCKGNIELKTNEKSMRSLVSEVSEMDSSNNSNNIEPSLMSQQSKSDFITIPQGFDDMKRCSLCHEKYKFPRRCRHHCSRCAATFCHKDGKITHLNIIPCGVPGTCLCNSCVEEIQRLKEEQNNNPQIIVG